MEKYRGCDAIVSEIIKNKAALFSFACSFFVIAFHNWLIRIISQPMPPQVHAAEKHWAFAAGQEDLGQWQMNPDVPTMKLYHCWDSSAVISKNDQSRSVTISKEGEIGASEAASMMLEPH